MAKRKKRMMVEVEEVWAHKFQDGLNFRTVWFARIVLPFPPGVRDFNIEIPDAVAEALIKS